MTGAALLGLVLLSMGWLFFLGGLAANYQALRRNAKPGLGPLPGIVGSVTVFFSLPALAKHGIEPPWPWLWILLPLAIDPWFVLLTRRSK
jgi:predicted Na+-dependent transporter